MRREERERVKMPDNLNSNEAPLLKMLHMFPLLMWTQFCKLFTCGETETKVVGSLKAHSQQLTKHLNPRRDGFQNALYCAPFASWTQVSTVIRQLSKMKP